MNLSAYLENIRRAREARQGAMKKVWAALEELAEADTLLDQALSVSFTGQPGGEDLLVADGVGNFSLDIPKGISALFQFGELF